MPHDWLTPTNTPLLWTELRCRSLLQLSPTEYRRRRSTRRQTDYLILVLIPRFLKETSTVLCSENLDRKRLERDDTGRKTYLKLCVVLHTYLVDLFMSTQPSIKTKRCWTLNGPFLKCDDLSCDNVYPDKIFIVKPLINQNSCLEFKVTTYKVVDGKSFFATYSRHSIVTAVLLSYSNAF